MNKEINKSLIETAVEVFETVAYLFPIPVEKENINTESISCENNIFIGINFQGYASGEIFICVPNPLSKTISANMLGIDEEDSNLEQKSLDAIKEVLNIICGSLLPKIYGEKPVFQLGTPYVIENIEKNIISNKFADLSNVKLNIDDSIVTCIFALKNKIKE